MHQGLTTSDVTVANGHQESAPYSYLPSHHLAPISKGLDSSHWRYDNVGLIPTEVIFHERMSHVDTSACDIDTYKLAQGYIVS